MGNFINPTRTWRAAIAIALLIVISAMHMPARGQTNPPTLICGIESDTSYSGRNGGLYKNGHSSTNGYVLTAQDTIRFLIIYAGFKSSKEEYLSLNNNPIWPDTNTLGKPALPNYQLNDNLFYEQYSQIDMTHNSNKQRNLSNFYYEMSQHSSKPFKVVATAFPERIDVQATSSVSWNNYAHTVFDTIQNRINRGLPVYTGFNWRDFDRRKNLPNYEIDNTDYASNGTSDGIADYVIIVWRYDGEINPGTGNFKGVRGSGGGFANIGNGLDSFSNGGYTLKIREGFTVTMGINTVDAIGFTFKHEFAHNLYDAPHVLRANGTHAYNMFSSTGWGMICGEEHAFSTPNAWESWYVGWLPLQAWNGITKIFSDVDGHASLL